MVINGRRDPRSCEGSMPQYRGVVGVSGLAGMGQGILGGETGMGSIGECQGQEAGVGGLGEQVQERV